MSVAVNLQNFSAPSENWDDDFDFHSQSGSPKRPNDSYGRPPTMRMSTATEDWDVDGPATTNSILRHGLARPNHVLADKQNTTLSNWVEDGPSTPQKAPFSSGFSAENWDDDFLDKSDSPVRQSPRASHAPSKNGTSGKLRAGVPLHHRRVPRQYQEEERESWDDEFTLKSSPLKSGQSSTPRRVLNPPFQYNTYQNPPRHDEFIYDDDDDDDVDFGSPTTEEDRTVTARSRRAPQQHTPPPPVPSIPFTLTPLTATPSTTTTTYTHLSAPFPRSPTASVFSVPTSSVAETTSLGSTAPLRPSFTRVSANNTLRHLPPSPPIHRERRRLRKKSRPHEGAMELMDMNPSSHYPLSESETEQQLDEVDGRRPLTPSPIVPDPIGVNIPTTPPQSTGPGGAILNRMGSIKTRWTGRKKKASLSPSEVAKNERRKDDNDQEYQSPRPRSSLSSLLHTTQTVPPPSSSWFFRPSSPAHLRHRNSQGKGSKPRSSYTGSRSGSMTDLSTRGSTASSSHYDDDDDSLSHKLPKRKSLGFVQFRNGFLSNGLPDKGKACDDETRSDLVKRSASKRPMSLQTPSPSTFQSPPSLRHASYTTPTAKKPAASTDDLRESGFARERERKQSTPKPMRLRARDSVKGKGRERDEGKDNEVEEAEDNRGFIRRLSFVGRHRRTKSGASMSHVEPMERVPSESFTMGSPKIQPLDRPPSLPPLPPFLEIKMPRRPPSPPSPSASSLLPPIELQPPSPPRNINIPSENDTNDTNHDPMLTKSSPVSRGSPGHGITPIPTSAPVSSPSFTQQIKTLESVKCSPTSKITPSGYTASLGRSTISPKTSSITDGAHRRNSLSDLKSDLKIPARISQAQQGLKRDLGMVRDFAIYIDQLKKQQDTYNDLLLQMQQKLDAQAQLAQQPISRAVSPSFFNLTKPRTRARSNTNPSSPSTKYKELTAALYAINSRYRISWECAELLVELADGTTGSDGAPSTSASAPVVLGTGGDKRGRERAITLSGDQSKPSTPIHGMSSSMILSPSTSSHSGPPPVSPPAWRASTGRHDLSHRQLVLLREMLNNAEAVLSTTDGSGLPLTVPEETTPSSTTESLRVNRDWRWGGPMSSTVTLPSEETNGEEPRKKKPRVSKMVGMSGLRDILRALKKNSSLNHPPPSHPRPPVVHSHASVSTGSLITDISSDLPGRKDRVQGGRPELGLGQETIVNKERGRDPTPLSIQIPAPSKPRRPSLASIFRIGSRKNTPPSMSTADLPMQYSDREYSESSRPGTGLGSNDHTGLEEDWDKMDSVSDLDAAAKALFDKEKDRRATLKKRRGNSPYLQYRAPSSSTSQLGRPCTPKRSASGSQMSIWADSPSKVRSRTPNHVTPRAPRLSNVDEVVEGTKSRVVESQLRRSSSRTSARMKSGSIRSMPPQPVLSESRLAMTPENIKPLLENAKEIHARLVDCITEIQQLLESEGVREISVAGVGGATGQSLSS